jgi:hypothetical protein
MLESAGTLVSGITFQTLNSTSKKVAATDANRTQTRDREAEEEFSEVAQDAELEELIWLPHRDSNPDMLIQRQETLDSAEFPRFY